ncbi:MAG: DASS family sodium-coupled anion symporter, partial [Mariprofundaceae bacterium]|nr:DASS family sodium-coupled anion symporter [Mariprofundaceae bacterium]
MAVVIDRSPLHVLLVRKGLPYVVLALIGLLAWWAVQQDAPAGLTAQGRDAIVVFLLCLVLWVTQLIPLAVTSLLGLALLPLMGVLPADHAYAMFGNNAVFFILGSFMLAAGVMRTGLSEHLALALLDRVGLGPRRLLLAMLLLPAFMAGFMPEHAVAAVLLPIAWEVVRGLGLTLGHRYAQSVFLALAWGAIIGGVTTLLGGARGPLALGMVEELTGQGFSFLDWTLAAAPLVLLMLGIAAVTLLLATPFDGLDVRAARQRIERRQLELGTVSMEARIMALLILATVVFWIAAGHVFGLAGIALISVVLMFSLRLVSWKDAQEDVNWGVVMMYGGAIAVAKALTVTGAGAWIADKVLLEGLSPGLLLMLFAIVTLLMTEGISNAAAVAILLPVAIPVGTAVGMAPGSVALAVGIVA